MRNDVSRGTLRLDSVGQGRSTSAELAGVAVMRIRRSESAPRIDPAERRRLEREAKERGFKALDQLQAWGKQAGITEEDVRREIEDFRAGR